MSSIKIFGPVAFLLLFCSLACQSSRTEVLERNDSSKPSVTRQSEYNSTFQCCLHRSATGECIHEAVPGCSMITDEKSGQLPGSHIPNSCCGQYSPGGICLHELIPGCSKNGYKPPRASDSCCSHWGANGVCYHELVTGCSK